MSKKSPKVVAFGGGHGLAATLTALRDLTPSITAVVTVADNGGSSGKIRDEFNFLPPGDLRMALAALCGPDEWGQSWAQIIQHRFKSSGDLNGHALGNLLMAALWDSSDDLVAGIDRVGDLLKIVGRVLPMSLQPLDIEGVFETTSGIQTIRGQIEVATAKGKLQSLKLLPENPIVTPDVLRAISEADWLTFGPGSWFSSVMPHFLSSELANAISLSAAKKIMVLNLQEPEGADEFAGSTPEAHLRLVLSHLPTFKFDIAIADPTILDSASNLGVTVKELGGELVVADVARDQDQNHHDPQKMSLLFSHIFQ
ncbi:MAG: uridine diphosphate-N-acetylglucosamine-binding protein YvcK [Actinomycetes bacterium]